MAVTVPDAGQCLTHSAVAPLPVLSNARSRITYFTYIPASLDFINSKLIVENMSYVMHTRLMNRSDLWFSECKISIKMVCVATQAQLPHVYLTRVMEASLKQDQNHNIYGSCVFAFIIFTVV